MYLASSYTIVYTPIVQEYFYKSCLLCIEISKIYLGLLPFQFSSVTQSCPTLCNLVDWRTTDFLIHL